MDRAHDTSDRAGRPLGRGLDRRYSSRAILQIGRRRKWQIVLPAIAVAAAASWWIHRLPDRYRSDALLLVVPQRVPDTFVRSTVTTRGTDRLQSMTQQILSRTQLEKIIREYDLYADRRKTTAMQDIVDSMRTRDIDIRPAKGDAFRLGVTSDDPETAMRVADRLVSLFILQTSHDRTTLAEGTDQFLETQLENARRGLIENETRLAEYRRRHHGELPTQLEANVRGLHHTETQMQVLADSLNRDRERQLLLERSIKDASLSELIDARSRAAGGDSLAQTAGDQLQRAEAALEEMRSTLTEQHPDIVALKQTISELRKRKDIEGARLDESAGASPAEALRRSRQEELRTELASVERQIAERTAEGERLQAVLLNYQKRIDDAPAREAELAVLTRDYDTLQQAYRGLLTKKQESEMAANLERQDIGAQFKVLDPARLPEQPIAPRRLRLYALAVLGGLVIGLIVAMIFEQFDRALRTRDDVMAILGLPVLAAIPAVSARPSKMRRAAGIASVAVALGASLAAIAWRLLN
jgi:protein tyrosine kinase modulator